MGFHRVLPAVGRILDMHSEIFTLSDDKLHKTFFTSEDNNTCFFGTCMIYCDLFHPVCGKPDKLEGSLVAYLPQFDFGLRQVVLNQNEIMDIFNIKTILVMDESMEEIIFDQTQSRMGR